MSSVSDDHKDRVEMQVCTRSIRYDSVAVLDTLQVIRVTLYVTCCLAGSQCSDLNRFELKTIKFPYQKSM